MVRLELREAVLHLAKPVVRRGYRGAADAAESQAIELKPVYCQILIA